MLPCVQGGMQMTPQSIAIKGFCQGASCHFTVTGGFVEMDFVY